MLRTAPRLVGTTCAITLLMSPAFLMSPHRASANDAQPESPRRILLTSEVLEHMDQARLPDDEPTWISNHFRLAGKGVRYSQPLSLGQRQLELNVSGPVMRHSLGLNVEVRF